MNKTVNINLAGLPFIMDEEAYEKLKEYIASLQRYFATTEGDGHSEIMQDIEARIAEILSMKLSGTKRIITMADVDEVITIIGKPEDMGAENTATNQTNANESKSSYTHQRRRLYRDEDNQVVGGVCAGLGAFFDIDPVWIRLVWAISFFVFGAGLLLYIILWVIIPRAKSPAEKLEMRGDKYDLDSIKRSFKEEGDRFEKRMKDLAEQYGGKEAKERYRRRSEDLMDSVSPAVKRAGTVIGKVALSIALFFIIGLFVVLALALFSGLTTVHFTDETSLDISVWNFVAMFTDSAGETNLVIAALALILLTPLFMILFGTVKALFGVRKRTKYVGIVASVLFWAGIVLGLVEGFFIYQRFDEKERITDNIILPSPKGDTLRIETKFPAIGTGMTEVGFGAGEYLAQFDPIYFLPEARINIVPSTDGKYHMRIDRISRGKNGIEAMDFASAIKVGYQMKDSTTLIVDRFSMLPQGTKFRGQRVTIVLSVPEGKYVDLGNSTRKSLILCHNQQDIKPRHMAGFIWKMEAAGLSCPSCTNNDNRDYDEDIDDDNW